LGEQIANPFDSSLIAIFERIVNQIISYFRFLLQSFNNPSIGSRQGVEPGPVIHGIDQRPRFGHHDGINIIGCFQAFRRTKSFDIGLDENKIRSADLFFTEYLIISTFAGAKNV
jgi:hypothetical protein